MFEAAEPAERPADPAVRRANFRRIVALFRPYKLRLGGVLALILFSSTVGAFSAFLVKRIFDDALPSPEHAADLALLNLLVGGLIAIAILTGAIGVVQTLLSNQVGQRVMHDLRTAVYRHLQRLSLAFFTRTRTGEVQSRLANDIGGVQEVVTSTATSIVSNVTTVIASVVAMFILDWKLTLFALALIPVFVWMTRRVGRERQKVAKVRQESMADISSLVQESLSVSGILLGKTMGRSGELGQRFEGVWFRYADAAWTLQDVSFEVAAGTTTALVGETGSGKTTAGYLVARLYDATRGTVAIDGIDVRDLTFASLAAAVGVVSQETYLFHSSVRENLRFAKPEASDDEVEEAARAAQIHELIVSLPEGYNTVVGERGYRFSGGEKQRIAIARTILRNPPILVLDEATSALDTQTERLVQAALERLEEGRTTIAIAHRLSTVRDADQIVVLDRGLVAEIGTHEELLAARGRYAALLARDIEGAPV